MAIRISTIIWIVILVFGAFGVYMVKYQVQDLKKEIALTEKSVAEEKKNLHVLHAEWAYLTRPERIKKLSEKYLDVKPLKGQQITELTSLPYNKGTEQNKNNSEIANLDTNVKLVSKVSGNENSEDE
ncbi:MAG: hypothetical protein WCJ33_07745 [Pseudomonadota bacterium]